MQMNSFFFDKQDKIFLESVNNSIECSKTLESHYQQEIHPNGIIDMCISQEIRMATAVISLLDRLQTNNIDERLIALNNLHNEVLLTSRTKFRRNTARVLIEIMKELIRTYGNEEKQLQLAHDFRIAATGKPTIVRKLLRRYHLLEMPEAWNQLVFDHHIHDANTKGRKSPTHLIMDAWVKGIRSLTVIYYNYIKPETAYELLEASKIMGIKVRIGLLYNIIYRHRLIDFIWVPQGFYGTDEFLDFIAEPDMQALMQDARQISRWREKFIFKIVDEWNQNLKNKINEEFSLDLSPISTEEYKKFVSIGQSSVLHLAELIHDDAKKTLTERVSVIKEKMQHTSDPQELQILTNQLNNYDKLTTEYFLELLEDCEHLIEKELIAEVLTEEDLDKIPSIVKYSPHQLVYRLKQVHSNSYIVLNLANTTPEEVINLLWDTDGEITHLEIFNVYDWQKGRSKHIAEINELMVAINKNNTPLLKSILLKLIETCKKSAEITLFDEDHEHLLSAASNADEFADKSKIQEYRDNPKLRPVTLEERVKALQQILSNIPTVINYYRGKKLFTRIGTDSTSRVGRLAGMGLAYIQCLPARTIKELKKSSNESRMIIPIRKEVRLVETYILPHNNEKVSWFCKLLRKIPLIKKLTYKKIKTYTDFETDTSVFNNGNCSYALEDFSSDKGDIVTLGGKGLRTTNGFVASTPKNTLHKYNYLNSNLSNFIKVFIGYVSALYSFQDTQDIAFLAWWGALIWFIITGVRNIFQAILGVGGLQRSPLMRWNNYVSWSRLCDSLMYTGISVILLESIVRVDFLEQTCGITASNNPLLSFTVISLVNGFYIMGHNYIRGLQTEAIIGNFFRSFLAIPISLVYNNIFFSFLLAIGVHNAVELVVACSAITSKMASDTGAALVEGYADKNSNVWFRQWDYKLAFEKLYTQFTKLELHFPEKGCLELLKNPQELLNNLKQVDKQLYTSMIINALDLMYLYYYQPRSNSTLRNIIKNISENEKLVMLRMQYVLLCHKDVSQLFIDEILGENFAKALSFYLDTHQQYLKQLQKICQIEY